MELVNASGLAVGVTLGLRPGGREHAVLCAKGTFQIPLREGPLAIMEPGEPLRDADTFAGEPGRSSPLFESDHAPFKPACDVLLVGSAHAPGYRPAERVTVGLRVGRLRRSFLVYGDRVWERGVRALRPSAPRRFATMPLTYEHAFGGADSAENPVGVGLYASRDDEAIVGAPLPATEEEGRPIDDPRALYPALSFGPIGRGWQPRARCAGTYDEAWRAEVFPYLPADFDERYHQAAPPAQQIPYPEGGEPLVLQNLTPEGEARSSLPRARVRVRFEPRRGAVREALAVLDTIGLEPDAQRVTLVYRASTPVSRGLLELKRIVVTREEP